MGPKEIFHKSHIQNSGVLRRDGVRRWLRGARRFEIITTQRHSRLES
jgi:hypothetical protein